MIEKWRVISKLKSRGPHRTENSYVGRLGATSVVVIVVVAMTLGVFWATDCNADKVLKIGLPAPFTSGDAANAIEFQRASEMAADEINQ